MGTHTDKYGRTKVYGAGSIKRMLQSQKVDHARDAHTSIADKPHASNREAERRRRQAERKAAKNGS
jgi:hypothetical protein